MRTTSETKELLRRRFKHYRDRLDDDAYRAKSEAVAARLRELLTSLDAGTVLAYWPIEGRREVDVRPIVRWLQKQGTRVALPVVDTFRAAGEARLPRMHATLLKSEKRLSPNQWGIYEPSGGQTVPASEIDVVIVPAIGAGRNMHRIGHGHGYYDAFLSRCDATTLCLTYDACLVEAVPVEQHDVPVDGIVTEREALLPPKAA